MYISGDLQGAKECRISTSTDRKTDRRTDRIDEIKRMAVSIAQEGSQLKRRDEPVDAWSCVYTAEGAHHGSLSARERETHNVTPLQETG